MTKGTIGLICLTMFLTLTVLTGGGWAEDWLGDNKILFMDKEPDATITAPDEFVIHSTSFDADEVYATLLNEDDYGKYDKLSIGKIDFCKQICFKLKGDDVERCVKTEWLYELLKMIQP